MAKEQEAIENIKIYIHDYISESVDEDGYTQYAISEEEQEFFKDIDTVLNMLKEKDKKIEKKDKIIEQINKDIEANIYLAESNYNVEELNDYARGVYDTYINMRKQYFERKVRE